LYEILTTILAQITNALNGKDVFFMNVGNANSDLIEVSVCANGIRSVVDFDAFGGDVCGNIGGQPCPLTQSGVITTISVAGLGHSASINCAILN
jgi:hypothetical protein